MSIQNEIDRLSGCIADAYAAVSERGGKLPETQNSANLAEAVRSIPDGVPPVPSGGIIMWAGPAIPDGWALCDGANGTPDLRDRFVLGAGGGYSVGAAGGEEAVTLTEGQMPRHCHNFDAYSAASGSTEMVSIIRGMNVPSVTAAATKNAGWGEPHNNMPPYYALAFIMKL